jgi:hypothetical protein
MDYKTSPQKKIWKNPSALRPAKGKTSVFQKSGVSLPNLNFFNHSGSGSETFEGRKMLTKKF